MLLSDWTDDDPERIYATLKRQSDYYNFGQRTLRRLRCATCASKGFSAARSPTRRMWGEMRMNPTDFADVSGYTYTYLMNGAAPAGNWTGLFKPGETRAAALHQRLVDEHSSTCAFRA